MNKSYLWGGAIFQFVNILALIIYFIATTPVSLVFIIKIVLGSMYALANIASFILIFVGLLGNDKK